MSSFHYRINQWAAVALCCTGLLYQVAALDIAYCSTLNTAATPANSSIYQSNGLCHDFCITDYAFAVLQDATCWCSDFAPLSTSSTASCSNKCPGYPGDLCGGIGLYGYIALIKAASGTRGAASTSQTSGSSSSANAPPQATVNPATVTVFATITPSVASPSPSSSSFFPGTSGTSSSSTNSLTTSSPVTTPSTSSSSPSSSISSTWTPTPVLSYETVTGQIRTVTVTPTAPPESQNAITESTSSSGGLNTGQAVGLTVGLVALVAIIGALIFFCFRKRRREREAAMPTLESTSPVGSSGGPVIPQRTMSENSRYMLATDGRQVVEGYDESTTPGSGTSRLSRLLPVDPRLDPFAPVYLRGDASKSRESVRTIQDNHDYSRRVHQQAPILRATNPDL